MKKQTYTFIVIAVIVLLAVLVFTNNQAKVQTPVENTGTLTGGMRVESNAIAVSDQGETDILIASLVVLTDPSYVAVHESNNGQPGKIIGTSQLIASGTNEGVVVQLSRKAVKGETLYTMLHKDNGDKVYSQSDEPVRGTSGEPIMMIVVVSEGNSSESGAVSI